MIARILVKALGGTWKIRMRCQATGSRLVKVIYSLLYGVALQDRGSWISLSAIIRGEPCFPHGPYGVYISGGATIGKNCVIFQHVTIGSNTLCDSSGIGAPTIGDNCYIGVGARIIGNIRIGDNVRIGANTFVYQDIADNSVVTCATPRIIQMRRKLNNSFYHKHKGLWRYYDDGAWKQVLDQETISLLERKFIN
jgi:serine O-acetyltransferase